MVDERSTITYLLKVKLKCGGDNVPQNFVIELYVMRSGSHCNVQMVNIRYMALLNWNRKTDISLCNMITPFYGCTWRFYNAPTFQNAVFIHKFMKVHKLYYISWPDMLMNIWVAPSYELIRIYASTIFQSMSLLFWSRVDDKNSGHVVKLSEMSSSWHFKVELCTRYAHRPSPRSSSRFFAQKRFSFTHQHHLSPMKK